MTDSPLPPPPPPSQPAGPPPGYYRASDGKDYPIPAGYYLGADGQFHPITTPAAPGAAAAPSYAAPSYAAPAGVAPVGAGGWRWDASSILILAGAAVVAIGAFLPWADIGGLITTNGMDGDGKITIVLAAGAAVLGVFGILKASKGMLIGSLVVAALTILVAIIDMADVSSRGEGIIEVSIGIGLYLTLIGGIVGVVGAVLAMMARK